MQINNNPRQGCGELLRENTKKTGYIDIKDTTVRLTKKGLDECQKPKHAWDENVSY